MNEQDLRDCFAMFAMCGLIMNKGIVEKIPELSYAMADAMLEARDPEPAAGLPPIKRRGRPKNDSRTN
jgi:hypothetical protein